MSDALASTTGQAPVVTGARRARPSSAETLAKGLGLRIASSDELIIRRRRRGKGWSYIDADGRGIKDPATIKRLAALAVPPAYAEVLYAGDPCAHLQAIGRDAAGRLQYRYHAEWEKVREMRKARRLSRLAEALPRIHRSIGQHLAGNAPQRELALAAVIELVARSAIRPGSESYARLRGTRGAATLLKSNVATYGETVKLTFRSKGGKHILKEFDAPRLCTAIAIMRQLPGRRLFQYKTESGEVRAVTTNEVNAFLREIAGAKISLKDFRTLLASASALEALAREEPAGDERQRRRQILNAVRSVAEDLANTPAICRKSYVHATVVAAFEEGVLERFSDTLKSCRSASRRAQVLAEIMARA